VRRRPVIKKKDVRTAPCARDMVMRGKATREAEARDKKKGCQDSTMRKGHGHEGEGHA